MPSRERQRAGSHASGRSAVPSPEARAVGHPRRTKVLLAGRSRWRRPLIRCSERRSRSDERPLYEAGSPPLAVGLRNRRSQVRILSGASHESPATAVFSRPPVFSEPGRNRRRWLQSGNAQPRLRHLNVAGAPDSRSARPEDPAVERPSDLSCRLRIPALAAPRAQQSGVALRVATLRAACLTPWPAQTKLNVQFRYTPSKRKEGQC
jgi:hypothetical protein